VNGVAAFPAGVTVVAHDGNKKELDAALAAGGRGAPPADRLPSQVVTKNKDTVTIDGVKLELLHWAPAHTSGDLVVYLPDQKIVFAGDIITGAAYIIQTNRPSPLIHANKMGSSEGWIATVKGMLALNADQYVPGHGDVQTKADIQTVLKADWMKSVAVCGAAMVKDGKSVDEIRVATRDAPRPAAGAGRGPAFASFTDVVYQELTKKRG
jgi:glyoxylase-like metal-dependent hydrolase (beta-lactamase superfamily II)